MQDNGNSTAGTESQQKLLLHPSQENKLTYKHKINEKWNTPTHKHAQNKNSCGELTTDKTTVKNLAGT